MKSINIMAPISIGELIDKITILEIKTEQIDNENQLSNINHELDKLNHTLHDLGLFKSVASYKKRLKIVNFNLWEIEDRLREKERIKIFDEEFIELARLVYFTNDERFKIKKEINLKFSSDIVEEKSYKEY